MNSEYDPDVSDLEASIKGLQGQMKQQNAAKRFFCVAGHVQRNNSIGPEQTCFRCPSKLVSACICGASLDLWTDYKPPFDRAFRGRDFCVNCRTLTPWAFNYLHRSELEARFSLYDEKLLERMAGYPIAEQYGLSKDAGSRLHYPTLLDRLRSRGIPISEQAHPSHRTWASFQKALQETREAVLLMRLQRCKHEIDCENRRLKKERDRENRRLRKERVVFKKIEPWLALSGQDFERKLATLLRERGHVVQHVGGPGDGGADLLLVLDGSKVVIQCKAHAKKIGPGAIRDLYGCLQHHGAEQGWLVSTAGFTEAARKFAKSKPIKLLTIADLLPDR